MSGGAGVVDARTLRVDGKSVRLKWIEPLPIYTQAMRYPLKQPAVDALKSRIDIETVTCELDRANSNNNGKSQGLRQQLEGSVG